MSNIKYLDGGATDVQVKRMFTQKLLTFLIAVCMLLTTNGNICQYSVKVFPNDYHTVQSFADRRPNSQTTIHTYSERPLPYELFSTKSKH